MLTRTEVKIWTGDEKTRDSEHPGHNSDRCNSPPINSHGESTTDQMAKEEEEAYLHREDSSIRQYQEAIA